MPLGSDSLKLKSYRAGYQGGHIWVIMLVPTMNPPSPSEWGWIEIAQSWVPQYTNLDIISRNIPTLKVCGCKVKCVPPCVCCTLNQKCTGLCECQGNCFGKSYTSNQNSA